MDITEWFPTFDVSAETDNELQSYFLKTPVVKSIVENKNWLVLGRKGTGKTAIYEYLKNAKSEDINGYITINLNFRDYPWPAHQLYKEALAGELSAYQKSWRYLFFVKALAKLIEVKLIKDEPLNDQLKWAKKYIETVYGNPDPSLKEVIFSKIARLDTVKGPDFDIDGLGIGLGEIGFEEISQNKVLQTKLRANAYTLLAYFEKIFSDNCIGKKFLIVLDQLDENWLAGEIDEYSKVLVNLVNVCRNISLEASLNGKLKVVPFLRTDIYHSLRFNDKNKLLQDAAVVISWDNDSLDDMFYERIKKYKPAGFKLDDDKKSGSLFEVTFVRQGTPVFRYITRRSFFRPRDVIVYFNKIREMHEPNNSGLYTSSELYEADREASVSVYNELIDEWSNQFPDIEKLLTVLQTIQVETFTYAEFIQKCEAEFPGLTEGKKREFTNFLFDNSVVGQKKQGRWEYLCNMPNLKINIENEFRTHHALKYRLHLIESRPNQAK